VLLISFGVVKGKNAADDLGSYKSTRLEDHLSIRTKDKITVNLIA
jgi:hypothetical protein